MMHQKSSWMWINIVVFFFIMCTALFVCVMIEHHLNWLNSMEFMYKTSELTMIQSVKTLIKAFQSVISWQKAYDLRYRQSETIKFQMQLTRLWLLRNHFITWILFSWLRVFITIILRWTIQNRFMFVELFTGYYESDFRCSITNSKYLHKFFCPL